MASVFSANAFRTLSYPQEDLSHGGEAARQLPGRHARSAESIGTPDEEDPAWPGHTLHQNAERHMRTFGQHNEPCRDAASDAERSDCSRVTFFKRWNAEAEQIVGKDSLGAKAPNPLRVRSWFFAIGEFLGKVDTVLRETEAIRCAGKERIEEILGIFRRHGIFDWISRAIETKQACRPDQAKERAEALIRYAFANTI
ncbi:hypothetical protein CAL13_18060 [Bordetella genomosp. 9]|uniref:Uncharacterized protein n=2 Tax=Bordetella genomosp. 9 TaxID=1416803 RepID=A0A1W6Z3E3_9BORD|nr:hypothetical protein CAL13_18060 [Bordetella genomosp. 9]